MRKSIARKFAALLAFVVLTTTFASDYNSIGVKASDETAVEAQAVDGSSADTEEVEAGDVSEAIEQEAEPEVAEVKEEEPQQIEEQKEEPEQAPEQKEEQQEEAQQAEEQKEEPQQASEVQQAEEPQQTEEAQQVEEPKTEEQEQPASNEEATPENQEQPENAEEAPAVETPAENPEETPQNDEQAVEGTPEDGAAPTVDAESDGNNDETTITISYEATTGGVVSVESEEVSDVAQGATATANEGYKFVNWTWNEEVVSENTTFVPEGDQLVDGAVFTANFSQVVEKAFAAETVVDNIRISLYANPGVLPEDAELRVDKISEEKEAQIEAKIDEVTGEDVKVADTFTFDIKIFSPSANDFVQPAEGTVEVRFSQIEEAKGDDTELSVYHVEDDLSKVTDMQAEVSDTEAVIDAEHFSLYVVTITVKEEGKNYSKVIQITAKDTNGKVLFDSDKGEKISYKIAIGIDEKITPADIEKSLNIQSKDYADYEFAYAKGGDENSAKIEYFYTVEEDKEVNVKYHADGIDYDPEDLTFYYTKKQVDSVDIIVMGYSTKADKLKELLNLDTVKGGGYAPLGVISVPEEIIEKYFDGASDKTVRFNNNSNAELYDAIIEAFDDFKCDTGVVDVNNNNTVAANLSKVAKHSVRTELGYTVDGNKYRENNFVSENHKACNYHLNLCFDESSFIDLNEGEQLVYYYLLQPGYDMVSNSKDWTQYYPEGEAHSWPGKANKVKDEDKDEYGNVYDATGKKVESYLVTKPTDEMLKAYFDKYSLNADDYEIVWYTYKYAKSDGFWHVDGIVREKTKDVVVYATIKANNADNREMLSSMLFSKCTGETLVKGNGFAPVGVIKLPESVLPATGKSIKYTGNESQKAITDALNYLDCSTDVLSANVNNDVKNNFANIIYDSRTVLQNIEKPNPETKFTSDELNNCHYHLDLCFDISNVQFYTVTYKGNLGNDTVIYEDKYATAGTYKVKTISEVIAKNKKFDQLDYEFLSWNTEADGSGITYNSENPSIASVTEDVTLYAQWNKEPRRKVTLSLLKMNCNRPYLANGEIDGTGQDLAEYFSFSRPKGTHGKVTGFDCGYAYADTLKDTTDSSGKEWKVVQYSKGKERNYVVGEGVDGAYNLTVSQDVIDKINAAIAEITGPDKPYGDYTEYQGYTFDDIVWYVYKHSNEGGTGNYDYHFDGEFRKKEPEETVKVAVYTTTLTKDLYKDEYVNLLGLDADPFVDKNYYSPIGIVELPKSVCEAGLSDDNLDSVLDMVVKNGVDTSKEVLKKNVNNGIIKFLENDRIRVVKPSDSSKTKLFANTGRSGFTNKYEVAYHLDLAINDTDNDVFAFYIIKDLRDDGTKIDIPKPMSLGGNHSYPSVEYAPGSTAWTGSVKENLSALVTDVEKDNYYADFDLTTNEYISGANHSTRILKNVDKFDSAAIPGMNQYLKDTYAPVYDGTQITFDDVVWYVFKKEGKTYHIDGYPTASVTYHSNYPSELGKAEETDKFEARVGYGHELKGQGSFAADGYIFDGWYQDSECKVKAKDSYTSVHEHLNFYAKWVKKDVIILALGADGYNERSLVYNGDVNFVDVDLDITIKSVSGGAQAPVADTPAADTPENIGEIIGEVTNFVGTAVDKLAKLGTINAHAEDFSREIVKTVEYNGKTYEISGLKVKGGSGTNVKRNADKTIGSYNAILLFDPATVVVKCGDQIVTDEFDIDFDFNSVKEFEGDYPVIGKLFILPREVTFTSASASKVDDGKPLTAPTVKVTPEELTEKGGFVTGEGASFDVTGKQVGAGKSANTFTYTFNKGTIADNYEVTAVEGTLEITPVTDGNNDDPKPNDNPSNDNKPNENPTNNDQTTDTTTQDGQPNVDTQEDESTDESKEDGKKVDSNKSDDKSDENTNNDSSSSDTQNNDSAKSTPGVLVERGSVLGANREQDTPTEKAGVLGERRGGTEDTTNTARVFILLVAAGAAATFIALGKKKSKKEDE